ncbi:MAG: transglycosylase SLT domain-containing protein [Bdellovibrionales bacterium]|nr:transglycosylase SLT domain-containing protein [Bdellovibrionales bacterium]
MKRLTFTLALAVSLLMAGSRMNDIINPYHQRLLSICESTWTRLCLRDLDSKRAEFDRGLALSGATGGVGERDEVFLSVVEAEKRYGVAYKLLAAVALVESGLTKEALSNKGAAGILQIQPGTAKHIWPEFIRTLDPEDPLLAMDPERDAHDIRLSVLLGAFYLSQLRIRFGGSDSLALASYNVGPTKIQQSLKEGSNPGMDYIQRVQRALGFFGKIDLSRKPGLLASTDS